MKKGFESMREDLLKEMKDVLDADQYKKFEKALPETPGPGGPPGFFQPKDKDKEGDEQGRRRRRARRTRCEPCPAAYARGQGVRLEPRPAGERAPRSQTALRVAARAEFESV